jgi:hypothetical protein
MNYPAVPDVYFTNLPNGSGPNLLQDLMDVSGCFWMLCNLQKQNSLRPFVITKREGIVSCINKKRRHLFLDSPHEKAVFLALTKRESMRLVLYVAKF